MAAQSLSQITRQLQSVSPTQAQRKAINKRISSLDNDFNEQSSNLRDISTTERQRGFTDISNAARRRGKGLAAGTIPQAQQARFSELAERELNSDLSNLRGQFNDREASLSDQLFGLDQNLFNQALAIEEADKQRAFQAEQAELSRGASAAASASESGILAKYGIDLNQILAGGGSSNPSAGVPSPAQPNPDADRGGRAFARNLGSSGSGLRVLTPSLSGFNQPTGGLSFR